MTAVNLSTYANNPVELNILPDGTETELKIIGMKTGKNKNGNDYMMIFFEILGYGDAMKDVSAYFGLPSDDMKPKEKVAAMQKITKFAKTFGIDLSAEFSEEDIVGKTGWAFMKVEKDQDGEDTNGIARFSHGA